MKIQRILSVLLLFLIVLSVVGSWRLRAIQRAGRDFLERRSHATLNGASAFATSWMDGQRNFARLVARVSTTDTPNGPRAVRVDHALLTTLLRATARDGEIVGARVLDRRGAIANAGTMVTPAAAAEALADSALRSFAIVVGSIEPGPASQLNFSVAVPICGTSLVTCIAVVLDIDAGKRLLPGMGAMQGASRSGRSVLVAGGSAITMTRSTTGIVISRRPSESVPAAIRNAIARGDSTMVEYPNDSGVVYVAVTSPVPAFGWAIAREVERVEAMADHSRQARLELGLAATGLLLIVLGWVGYDRTVGARRMAMVARAEARLATIVRSASEAILIVDDDGLIEVANPAASALFERSDLGLAGQHLAQLLDADSRHVLDGALSTARIRGSEQRHTPSDMEFCLTRGDGTRRVCEMTASVSQGTAGGFYTLFIRDVTDRREMQLRLQRSERLAAISKLVGGVAHELNNPLAAILLTTELLAEKATGEDRADFELVQEMTHRVARIVRDLLRFVEEYPLSYRVVSLRSTIEAVMRETSARVAAMGATLEAAPCLEELLVCADAAALRQAIENVIVNGAQAAGASGVVRLAVEKCDSHVRLWVTDTGPGVPSEIRHRIFEPFFSTKGVGGGAGLGLAVSFAIVTQHRGTIELENRAAPGASFLMTLPLYDSESCPPGAQDELAA